MPAAFSAAVLRGECWLGWLLLHIPEFVIASEGLIGCRLLLLLWL